jgi:hypothetical protein
MVRAPDSYVYPAPTNIIEVFVAPFEFVLSPRVYAKLNRYILLVVFFIPLCLIALYESLFRTNRHNWAKKWFRYSAGFDEDDGPLSKDPTVDEPSGLKISRVPFDEITSHFPNTELGTEAIIMAELRDVRAKLDELMSRLDATRGVDASGPPVIEGPSTAGGGKQHKSKKKKSGSGSNPSNSSD